MVMTMTIFVCSHNLSLASDCADITLFIVYLEPAQKKKKKKKKKKKNKTTKNKEKRTKNKPTISTVPVLLART